MNPYEVLDISPGASSEEIKAAYHGMAKKWHPDRYTGQAKAEAEQRFRMLAEAYNMLKDLPQREPAPAAPASAAPPVPVVLDTRGDTRPGTDKTADEWFREARTAFEEGAMEKAVSLVHYAIRLSADHADFHALHARILDATNGDKRVQVRALETALRLNPKDTECLALLAQTFESLGQPNRARRYWTLLYDLAPNHHLLVGPGMLVRRLGKEASAPTRPGSSANQPATGTGSALAEMASNLKQAVSRIFKR
jgi:curved DNA-binding protein CbpA